MLIGIAQVDNSPLCPIAQMKSSMAGTIIYAGARINYADRVPRIMAKPLARWTIGNTNPDGYACLIDSIESFTSFYDVDVLICHNCDKNNLPDRVSQFTTFDQRNTNHRIQPTGVAWKLYPPRLDITRHEILIDNDIVFEKEISEIKTFFVEDCTLLLQGNSRTYGRFEKFVPREHEINSGIYGMPPGFNLENLFNLHINSDWEKNAFGEHDKNETFDEQGFVAFALLQYPRHLVIPNTSVVGCEYNFCEGDAYHFIGLNRQKFHKSYRLYRSLKSKIHL